MSTRDIMARLGIGPVEFSVSAMGETRPVRYDCSPECPVHAETLRDITPHRAVCPRFSKWADAVDLLAYDGRGNG